jgi:predicted ATPase
VPPPNGLLIGRDRDLSLITAFVDEATAWGAALLVAGEPGVGKTALLDMVVAHVFKQGHRVLRVTGAEFEASLSFAGLNQLVYPLLDHLDALNATHRSALGVAIGLTSGAQSDQMLVANATLALLECSGA